MLKNLIFCFTRLFFKFFFRIEVDGIENIPQNGPLIFASNHISNYDPPAIMSFVYLKRKDIHVVAKKELFTNPLVGYFLKKMGAIPIDRKNPQISSIKKSIEILNQKKSLLIFPEGTRKKENKDIEVKDGISFIAYKTNSKILPLKIDIAKNKSKLGKIIIVFGKPIDAERYRFSDKQSLKNLSKEVMERIYSLKTIRGSDV
jgi:1-acyl-sn-glycerol-3-phosphate acyltransferase